MTNRTRKNILVHGRSKNLSMGQLLAFHAITWAGGLAAQGIEGAAERHGWPKTLQTLLIGAVIIIGAIVGLVCWSAEADRQHRQDYWNGVKATCNLTDNDRMRRDLCRQLHGLPRDLTPWASE